ncbi:MAG: metallophosphoesterase [Candidatus Poribacteria bacterium]|nr:metallophosphoesterase [Candidatus Poribacteria bacterium]
MIKLILLFILLVAVFATLLSLTGRQPVTPPAASQIVRYSPSAIPARPANRAERFDFIAYGDTRDGHDIHRTLIKHMIALNPDLVIHTGDLVSKGRKDDEWDTFFEVIDPLAQKVPYYTIRGNHDRGRHNYEKRFAPPNDSGTDRYYAFDHKNVHFIALDTNQSIGKMSPQRYWLEKNLSSTDKPHVVAFFHHPPFGVTKGRGDNKRVKNAFHDLFVRHSVNLVVSGHDHLYYRTQRNGITYITTGGGGAPLYDVDNMLPQLPSDTWGKYHHVVHFTVTGGLIKGTVIDIDGKVKDSFTVTTRRGAKLGPRN